MEKIIVDGKRLVDSLGRERIFNGLNVCDKGVYNEKTGKRDYGTLWHKGLAKELKENGFELIRLGLIWDAVEPKKGEYNKEYIDFILDILDECESEGIYVFLDMHQDLYSGFGDGCGDGAPDWACLTDKYKYHKAKFVWAEGYFWGRAVHRAFDNFWGNKDGVQDDYHKMWSHIAETAGNRPAVIGYDVMNEPFPGKSGGKIFRKIIGSLIKTTITDSAISKGKLLKYALSNKDRHKVLDLYGGDELRKITKAADGLGKEFDEKKYSPFLNKAAEALNKINDKFIIIENSYFSNLGIPCTTPAPEKDGKKFSAVFAPHAYDFMVDTPSYKYASNERIKAIFDEHLRTQERLDVPVIVGEWGGFTEGNEWFHHIKFLLELFDSRKWSQTYWTYFNGILESEVTQKVLCRPHPVAVTGKIIDYKHDRENETFTLTYEQEKDYDGATEIFIHKPVKEIKTDGEIEEEKITETRSILKIKTAVGTNKIEIKF
ncbi:MAG: cellulase family glycosylhydrolase [Clostridia bacterium]|nr:cellulase family glycosylhydrolase [Clostridia bacterium]